MNHNLRKSFIIFILATIIASFYVPQALSLGVDTHRAINEHIAQELYLDNYLKNQLGMHLGVKTKFNAQQIFKLVGDGGAYEDAGVRSLNHFHNPLKNKGILGQDSALDWATLPVGAQTL